MQRTTVRFPATLRDRCEEHCGDTGEYADFSALVRDAVREKIEELELRAAYLDEQDPELEAYIQNSTRLGGVGDDD